jgi:hypothetical protein
VGRIDSRASLGALRFGGCAGKATKLEREGSLGTEYQVGC